MLSFVSSKNFDYSPTRKIFVAEISLLPDRFQFGQVYPDACDAGFVMVSDRTGEHVRFVMCGTDRDGEDIAGWRLVPTRDEIRRNPRLQGITCLIIND